jgi:enoyl-CoA hydratase/carnithine racemase
MFNMRKPTIAAVEGYAVAGGFELAISADFLLCADECKIGDFHIRRALFGGAGPIYRLPRYIGLRKSKGTDAHRQAALRQGSGGMGTGNASRRRRSSTS